MMNFTKESGPGDLTGVTRVRVGVSWDTSAGMSSGFIGKIKKKMGVNLDLIAILMQGERPVRYCGVGNNDPLANGSVLHSGDNTTGKGDGDDEVIDVDLTRVQPNISEMFFTIAAFQPMTSFARAENVSFTVYDGTGGSFDPVAVTMPSLFSSHNIHKVLKLARTDGYWQMEVVDQPGNIQQGERDSLLRFAMR